MHVSIKDLSVQKMDLGNRGVEFDVYDGKNEHLGDLVISRGGIEWCKGKTARGNGIKRNWKEVIVWFEEP